MPQYGYAGQILTVDLSSGKITKQSSADYTDKFIGGHGLAARLYWEMVPPHAKASDPENCLICASGPVAGFPGFASFRWKICAKTPLYQPESFNYCNLGERWGALLKYAGYDALAVRGIADKPVYLYIHDGKVEIKDAALLKGKSTYDTDDILKAELGKGVGVLTAGPAAENQVPFATVFASGASGSGGMGAVMGSKNLKAIVVAGDKHPEAAHPVRVRELARIIQDGRNKTPVPAMWGIAGLSRPGACYGCGIGCTRELYPAEGGRSYKALCQATNVYLQSMRYTDKRDLSVLLAARLCDGYGLDTIVMDSMLQFLEGCYQEGILDEKKTGLPLSKIGGEEFIRELTRKIAFKEGFGATLAKGVIGAAAEIGPRAVAILPRYVATRGSEKKDYDPRMFITTALIYATEPRRAISQCHDVANIVMMWQGMGLDENKTGTLLSAENIRKVAKVLWGSETAADFSTYEGKAMAAKKLQDRVFAKDCLVVCDLRWTMTLANRILGKTADTVSEAQVYAAITGKEMDDAEFVKIGERIFNLQRAVLLRQGRRGRRDDTILDYFFTDPLKQGEVFFNADALVPGKGGEPLSKVDSVVEKDKFEKMLTEYYGCRGWDAATGFPTRAKFDELGLDDVADDLGKHGLLK